MHKNPLWKVICQTVYVPILCSHKNLPGNPASDQSPLVKQNYNNIRNHLYTLSMTSMVKKKYYSTMNHRYALTSSWMLWPNDSLHLANIILPFVRCLMLVLFYQSFHNYGQMESVKIISSIFLPSTPYKKASILLSHKPITFSIITCTC